MYDACKREDDQKHRGEVRDVSDRAEDCLCEAVLPLACCEMRTKADTDKKKNKEQPDERE